MNLETVISTINIPEDKILNVYVTGSRVYGTNDANSDWDFFVIVEDDADLQSGWELQEVGDVNAGIAKISHFVDIILNRDQNLQAICCLFVPQEFIWLDKAKNLHERYKVHKYSLKQSILSKACSCFHRAEWYCNEAEKTENEDEKARLSRKSKKMIFHCLRYLHLGLQLFDTGKIYDFKVANHYWTEIQNIDSVKWIDYEKVYRPVYLELLHKLPRQIDQMVEGFSSDPLLTEMWRLTHLPIIQQGYQLSIVNHCQEIARHVAPYEDKKITMLAEIEKEFPQVLEVYKEMFDKHIQLCEEIQRIYNELLKNMLDSINNEDNNTNNNNDEKKNKTLIKNGSDFVKAFWKVAHDDPYSKCLLNMNKFLAEKLKEENITKYILDNSIGSIEVPLRSVLLFFEISPRTTFDTTWNHKYNPNNNVNK
jgi:hypothetical protein